MRVGRYHRAAWAVATVILCFHASQSAAQSPPVHEAPLSVIDWLGTQGAQTPATIRPTIDPDEPAVTQSGSIPDVKVMPLTTGAPRQIGLVPADVTGLPDDIWLGSDPAHLTKLFKKLPDLALPAAQSLLYTLLLAEAQAPGGDPVAGDALALTRVDKLVELGALDPALSLIEQAGVTISAQHFDLWMNISLLNGTEDRACSVLSANPHLTRDYGVRILCAARGGDWENAALTFGSAQALRLMPEARLSLIDRFLHPEGFEDAEPLRAPRDIDPLSFRLFEAIGEPLPTRALPRAYAVADLRDIAGWKSQLEAAERLTRAGALPDNRLLGLYTDRQPAASGGVWDRVAALQRFETALSTQSAEAIAKTLPPVWNAMREAELEISFAALFAEDLSGIQLTGSAAAIRDKVSLLSPMYETAAVKADVQNLYTGIAQGDVSGPRPEDEIEGAVYDAFNGADARPDLIASLRQKRLGAVILNVLKLLNDGASGDAGALRDALATLRALGLEDTARRAALQTLLLDR